MADTIIPGFCRDCRRAVSAALRRCAGCASPRVLRHVELDTLAIAHVDCDAFYAAIEKRDNPSLADNPVIVGGGVRGVVLTACYVARTFGVRSAMPMFEARRLCPHASIVRPNMDKYAEVAREVRVLMAKLTPLVEPISIDEAFLDLSGTARLHGRSPAQALASFAAEVEGTLGITVSVGLSCNKFLAKIASDLDKPRGFAVLGRQEAAAFLASKPITLIFGVGKIAQQRFARDGVRIIGDVQQLGEREMTLRYGAEGARLARLSLGVDDRAVRPDRETKSISAETTFDQDIGEYRPLEVRLWQLCQRVSSRLKHKALAGSGVTLKLKSADFRTRTRAQMLAHPTQLGTRIFASARELLAAEIDGTRYRLIGVGVSRLSAANDADLSDFLDRRSAKAEEAIDRLRARFGDLAVINGIVFESDDREQTAEDG
jgi:DNA polymerase-4